MASVESLKDCISRLPAALQNQPVTNLHEIAKSFPKWKSVLPFLGLDETHKEHIIEDHDETATRRLATLRAWKTKHGKNATYKTLLQSFHEANRMDMVEMVIDVAQKQASATTGSVGDQQSCNRWFIVGPVFVGGLSILVMILYVLFQPPKPAVYNDCEDALNQGQTTSGIYTIQPDNQPPFQAYCDMETDDGGWTVFQRRMDGSVDFYRFWKHYQQGFGNLSREFWLGLDKIHRLTSTATQLRVDLKDFDGNSRYALYASFSVGDSSSKYILLVSGYTGTAGDSLGSESKRHNGYQFSTKDRDNDVWEGSCAQTYKGGWWYDWCHASNLNGRYLNGQHMSYADGVNWHAWRGYHYSLKFTEMKLKQY